MRLGTSLGSAVGLCDFDGETDGMFEDVVGDKDAVGDRDVVGDKDGMSDD